MRQMICVTEAAFGKALTRGQLYTVLAIDNDKGKVRVKGDNGRTRWFPAYCFDRSDRSVPMLASFHLDDPISRLLEENQPIEVTVELSTGERRWCVFATPSALATGGDWIEGTQVRFHYGMRHLIIAMELSEDLIGRILRYIDGQGELAQSTRSFNLGLIDDELAC